MRDKPCLTSADLHKAMAACRAEAEKNNWKVSIAIVDDGGYLLLLRPHGRRLAHHGGGRRRKGAHVGGDKAAEQVLRGARQGTPAFATFPAGILIQGGVPIMARGECVGAIGVSGVASHEDEQIAQAGVRAAQG